MTTRLGEDLPRRCGWITGDQELSRKKRGLCFNESQRSWKTMCGAICESCVCRGNFAVSAHSAVIVCRPECRFSSLGQAGRHCRFRIPRILALPESRKAVQSHRASSRGNLDTRDTRGPQHSPGRRRFDLEKNRISGEYRAPSGRITRRANGPSGLRILTETADGSARNTAGRDVRIDLRRRTRDRASTRPDPRVVR